MKLLNYFLLGLILVVNLIFAQPALADPPKVTKSPEYIELTKTIDLLQQRLVATESEEATSEVLTPEELQKKIDELSFQKYALEKGINWSQCRNETTQTIAVYGPKPKKSKTPYDNALYFLGAGQTTPAEWDCQGIYLPNDIKLNNLSTEFNQPLEGAVAIKIFKGTQLIAKNNTETGALELNVAPSKFFKSGDINWYIPNVSANNIALRVPDVPSGGGEEAD